jgi:hypothetical protein
MEAEKEIEITPAMLKAGCAELEGHVDGWDDDAKRVARIFSAMRAAQNLGTVSAPMCSTASS